MTAYGTVETAVQAMREGAYDFVEKPLKRMTIVKSVRKAAERQSLVAENRSLQAGDQAPHEARDRRQSPALRRVLDVATQAAPSSATVLVLGESGTGKELLARYIHRRARARAGRSSPSTAPRSRRRSSKRSSSATSAARSPARSRRREGRFARARGGTLFLDEIGELSPVGAGEAPARAAGGRVRAGRRQHGQRRRAHRRRDQSRSRCRGRGRALPRGSLLSPQRHRGRRRRRCARGARTSRCSSITSSASTARRTAARGSTCTATCWRSCSTTRGRATCASSRTSSSARSCSAERTRSASRTCPTPSRRRRAPSPSVLTFAIGTTARRGRVRMIRETLRHTKGDKSLAAQLLGISTRTIYRKLGEVGRLTARRSRDLRRQPCLGRRSCQFVALSVCPARGLPAWRRAPTIAVL